jgi:hypothetical protein
MDHAEDDAFKNDCDHYAAGKSMKLLLELAAKGDLFAEGGREAKKNPESDFGQRLGQQTVHGCDRCCWIEEVE